MSIRQQLEEGLKSLDNGEISAIVNDIMIEEKNWEGTSNLDRDEMMDIIEEWVEDGIKNNHWTLDRWLSEVAGVSESGFGDLYPNENKTDPNKPPQKVVDVAKQIAKELDEQYKNLKIKRISWSKIGPRFSISIETGDPRDMSKDQLKDYQAIEKKYSQESFVNGVAVRTIINSNSEVTLATTEMDEDLDEQEDMYCEGCSNFFFSSQQDNEAYCPLCGGTEVGPVDEEAVASEYGKNWEVKVINEQLYSLDDLDEGHDDWHVYEAVLKTSVGDGRSTTKKVFDYLENTDAKGVFDMGYINVEFQELIDHDMLEVVGKSEAEKADRTNTHNDTGYYDTKNSQYIVINKLVHKHNDKTGKKEYALVSKDGSKVLEWYGTKKPSEETVKKSEQRVQFFKHAKADAPVGKSFIVLRGGKGSHALVGCEGGEKGILWGNESDAITFNSDVEYIKWLKQNSIPKNWMSTVNYLMNDGQLIHGSDMLHIDQIDPEKSMFKKYDTTAAPAPLLIPDEENLGVPRRNMPQIKRKHMEKFIDWLKEEGVKVKEVKIPLTDLKPTQKEFNTQKVHLMMNEDKHKLSKPLFVSKDNYILDGHHRWLAQLNIDDTKKAKCIQVDLDAKEFLDKAKDFDKVRYKDLDDNTFKDTDPNLSYADVNDDAFVDFTISAVGDKVVIDFTNFEQEDNGDTTHYDGNITIDGKEVHVSGNDRRFGNPQDVAIMDAIKNKFGINDDSVEHIFSEMWEIEDGYVLTIEQTGEYTFKISSKDNGEKTVDILELENNNDGQTKAAYEGEPEQIEMLKAAGFYFDNADEGLIVYSKDAGEGNAYFIAFVRGEPDCVAGIEDGEGNVLVKEEYATLKDAIDKVETVKSMDIGEATAENVYFSKEIDHPTEEGLYVKFKAVEDDMNPEQGLQIQEDIDNTKKRLEDGDGSAWFTAVVEVTDLDGDVVGSDNLGGCNYGSFEEFMDAEKNLYWKDMIDLATEDFKKKKSEATGVKMESLAKFDYKQAIAAQLNGKVEFKTVAASGYPQTEINVLEKTYEDSGDAETGPMLSEGTDLVKDGFKSVEEAKKFVEQANKDYIVVKEVFLNDYAVDPDQAESYEYDPATKTWKDAIATSAKKAPKSGDFKLKVYIPLDNQEDDDDEHMAEKILKEALKEAVGKEAGTVKIAFDDMVPRGDEANNYYYFILTAPMALGKELMESLGDFIDGGVSEAAKKAAPKKPATLEEVEKLAKILKGDIEGELEEAGEDCSPAGIAEEAILSACQQLSYKISPADKKKLMKAVAGFVSLNVKPGDKVKCINDKKYTRQYGTGPDWTVPNGIKEGEIYEVDSIAKDYFGANKLVLIVDGKKQVVDSLYMNGMNYGQRFELADKPGDEISRVI
jgi:Zn finger protein HypA/HybF involved in hydrogenase expression